MTTNSRQPHFAICPPTFKSFVKLRVHCLCALFAWLLFRFLIPADFYIRCSLIGRFMRPFDWSALFCPQLLAANTLFLEFLRKNRLRKLYCLELNYMIRFFGKAKRTLFY